jgi:hypothetical protein
MHSTGEAGMREAHALDARLVVLPKMAPAANDCRFAQAELVQLRDPWSEPDCMTLSRWFHERVKRDGGRMKKTTIVALARKLLVALWRYVATGVVVEGAVMKAT